MRGVPGGLHRSRQSPVRVRLHQLHQLRPAVHHHSGHSLRPAEHHHGGLHHVRRCRAEYEDPANRRFHAQPNACPECGPSLSAEIAEAQRRLAEGEILAIKGLGGFHLACDARNAAAVARLRARKRRSDKPFAVMVRDLEAARELCVVDDAAARAMSGPRHPIVILPRREGAGLPEGIAPGNPTLGVMLPYTPLHHLLFRERGVHGAGDDQRQSERGANRSREPRCARAPGRGGRLVPDAQSRHLHAGRRFGGADL